MNIKQKRYLVHAALVNLKWYVGAKIAHLHKNGTTYREIAEQIGVNRRTLHRIIHGEENALVDFDTFILLCLWMEVTPSELLRIDHELKLAIAKQKETAKRILIANDFSVYPAGLSEKDGHASAQLFRQKFLVPALNEYKRVEVYFEGVAGASTTWIREAFGGLITYEGFKHHRLVERLFIFDDVNPPRLFSEDSLASEAYAALDRAAERKNPIPAKVTGRIQ